MTIYFTSMAFTAIMLTVCFLIGTLICGVLQTGNDISQKIVTGFLFIMALFLIIAMPFMLLKGLFSSLFVIFISIVGVMLIVSAIFFFRHFNSADYTGILQLRHNTLIWAVAILMISIQIVMSTYLQHIDYDDSFYITVATTAVKSNTILGFDPTTGLQQFQFPLRYGLVGWELFLAILSKLFAIAPAALAHTVIIPLLIMISYLTVYNLSQRVSQNENQTPFFIMIVAAINFFGNYNPFSQASFLLLRMWQGKAVLANIVLIALISAVADLIKNYDRKNGRRWLNISIVILAGICTTVAGDYLMLILFVALILPLFLIKRFVALKNNIIPFLLSLIPFAVFTTVNIAVSYGLNQSQVAGYDFFSIVQAFSGVHSVIAALFIVSVVYIFCRGYQLQKMIFCYSTLILIVAFINPYSAGYFADKAVINPVYWRLFWLLPVYPAIAFAFSHMIATIKIFSLKMISAAGLCLFIVKTGAFMYTRVNYSFPENIYKLSQATIDIADYIEKDSHGEANCVLLPDNLSPQLRQYDANIQTIWSRQQYVADDYGDKNQSTFNKLRDFYNLLYSNNDISSKTVCAIMKEYNIKYLVLPLSSSHISQKTAGELEFRVDIDNYNVFTIE